MNQTRRTDRDQATPADQGLSLIELVLAMALFALVAVMGSQALTGMIRLREGLTERSSRTSALAEVTSLLRGDLNAMMPMLFYPPDRARPQAALRLTGGEGVTLLALSRGGLARFDAGPGTNLNGTASLGLGTGRVEWQLRDGLLRRSYWPSLIPAETRAKVQTGQDFGPDLGGIEALQLRSYWPQIGWVAGTGTQLGRSQTGALPLTGTAGGDSDGAAATSEAYSNSLPLAVELTLVTGHFGEISLVESLK